MSEARLALYSVFHLNLGYSSLEEEQRPEVVERCYRPLLRLARGLPLGIELTGQTLETLVALDPDWVAELAALVREGPAELVGSGYAQLIGPLVPASVNAANLRLGNEAYERILGIRPRLAFVNEQSYSASLVEHYLAAGYQAIVMEWDNPASAHPEWPDEWRYLPQRARGAAGATIPIVWNSSIAFQQFQRYAHRELELHELVEFLARGAGEAERALPLYGNDAEIFDFRPGRYATEPPLAGSEWGRIAALFEALAADARFRLVRPSEALALLGRPGAGNELVLESAEQPVPTKKQGKYNVTRWAVTGRDDLAVNTACSRITRALETHGAADDAWRELCELWSSDLRTHVTDRRWHAFRERLARAEARLVDPARPRACARNGDARVAREGRFLRVDGDRVCVRLNLRRGLAIDALSFGGEPLVGTLPHGYYDDISLGADFYTGHLVFEAPARPKVTDLAAVEPEIREEPGLVEVAASLATALGPVEKVVRIELEPGSVEVEHRLGWAELPVGSLRVGHVTLRPEAFSRESLFYASQNGGAELERFALAGRRVEHGAPVSFLVSASHAVGVTGGFVELGDSARAVRVEVDREEAALVGLVTYRELDGTYFFRLALSAREMDETSRPAPAPGPLRVAIRPAQLG